jgi:hypothetical protein
MGYLELGIVSVAALGILGFAFALAWVDASPRGRAAQERGVRSED